MNIFEEVKQHITARQIAEHHGIKIKRNGMCCCPFHPDKNPSMKVDATYHCFGCGVGGDAIDMMARLENISQFEAVKKIIEIFSLPIAVKKNARRKPYVRPQKTEEQKMMELRKKVDDWISQATDILIQYMKYLEKWKVDYKPNPDDEGWNELFCEALVNESRINAYLDTLMYGSGEELLEFFKENREEVRKIEERVNKYQRCRNEECGDNCSGRNDDSRGDIRHAG